MTESDKIIIALNDWSKLLHKAEQYQRILNILWQQRIKIYSKLMIELKKGRGFFSKKIPDIETEFPVELTRLATINKRESRAVSAVSSHKDETFELKNAILLELSRIKLGNKSLYQVVDASYVESLSRVINHYFDSLQPLHAQFLKIEQKLIYQPSMGNLKVVFCSMINLQKQSLALQASYKNSSARFSKVIDIQHSINNLYDSINDDLKHYTERYSGKKGINLLLRARAELKRLHSIKQLYGKRLEERMALNIADFPKIVISIGIRMAVIAPLLFEATNAILGYKPSLKITFSDQYPRFYLDIYLFLISYVAYGLDVIPGLAKYTIEGPQLLLKKIKAKTGTVDPFDFKCA